MANIELDLVESPRLLPAVIGTNGQGARIVSGEIVWHDSAADSEKLGGVAANLYALKTYVDALIAGLSWKTKVKAATTVAGTLASDFENGDTIDGVVLATDDRILIKDQAVATENGIYVVNASGAPTRATDADSGAELVNASVYVSEGTANADKQFVCTTNAPITLGATNIVFTVFSSGGGGSWGSITGTLNDQTDLQAELDAKQDAIITVSTTAPVSPNVNEIWIDIS